MGQLIGEHLAGILKAESDGQAQNGETITGLKAQIALASAMDEHL